MYPVAYEQDIAEDRNRLTVFFRLLLIIPHYLWACIYGLGFVLAVFVAWFAIVFTGRWPAGLYGFAAGFVRFATRLNAYYLLGTDKYPPFDGGEHPEYPVRVSIAPRQEEYSRMKALVRIIIAIPIYIAAYALSLWSMILAIALWFIAVITGRTPPGLVGAMKLPLAFYGRSLAYFALVTEDWPPFNPDAPLTLPPSAAGSAPAVPPGASPS